MGKEFFEADGTDVLTLEFEDSPFMDSGGKPVRVKLDSTGAVPVSSVSGGDGGEKSFSADGTTEKFALVDAQGHVQVDVLSGGGGTVFSADGTNALPALVGSDRIIHTEVGHDGTNYKPLKVDATNRLDIRSLTATRDVVQVEGGNSTAVVIDGSGAVQPISGSVGLLANQTVRVQGYDGTTYRAPLVDNTGALKVHLIDEKVRLWDGTNEVALQDSSSINCLPVKVINQISGGGGQAIVYSQDGTTTKSALVDAAGHVQADVLTLPSLPAGTQNIGDVDVLSLPEIPAGEQDIGRIRLNEPTETTVNNLGAVQVIKSQVVMGIACLSYYGQAQSGVLFNDKIYKISGGLYEKWMPVLQYYDGTNKAWKPEIKLEKTSYTFYSLYPGPGCSDNSYGVVRDPDGTCLYALARKSSGNKDRIMSYDGTVIADMCVDGTVSPDPVSLKHILGVFKVDGTLYFAVKISTSGSLGYNDCYVYAYDGTNLNRPHANACYGTNTYPFSIKLDGTNLIYFGFQGVKKQSVYDWATSPVSVYSNSEYYQIPLGLIKDKICLLASSSGYSDTMALMPYDSSLVDGTAYSGPYESYSTANVLKFVSQSNANSEYYDLVWYTPFKNTLLVAAPAHYQICGSTYRPTVGMINFGKNTALLLRSFKYSFANYLNGGFNFWKDNMEMNKRGFSQEGSEDVAQFSITKDLYPSGIISTDTTSFSIDATIGTTELLVGHDEHYYIPVSAKITAFGDDSTSKHRLALQIYEDGAWKPMATVAIGKNSAITEKFDLLGRFFADWSDGTNARIRVETNGAGPVDAEVELEYIKVCTSWSSQFIED